MSIYEAHSARSETNEIFIHYVTHFALYYRSKRLIPKKKNFPLYLWKNVCYVLTMVFLPQSPSLDSDVISSSLKCLCKMSVTPLIHIARESVHLCLEVRSYEITFLRLCSTLDIIETQLR